MEVLEEITDADEAFLSSITPKEINGVKLEPFSLMRQAIALEIGGLNTESAFFEAVIRVWVCTLQPLECIKAKRDKDQAALDAFAWADKQGISITNAGPLMDLYKQINDEIFQSSNATSDDGEPPSPNSGGRPA